MESLWSKLWRATVSRKPPDLEDQSGPSKAGVPNSPPVNTDNPTRLHAPISSGTASRASDFQDRCREVLLRAKQDENLKASIAALRGVDAQCMVSFMLHDYEPYDPDYHFVFDLIYRLVTEAHVLPCFYNPTALRARHGDLKNSGQISLRNEAKSFRTRRIHTPTQEIVAVLKSHAREFIKWAHLSHENIIPFHGVFENGPQLYLVSPVAQEVKLHEYLEGSRGHSAGSLDLRERTFLASDVLRGLQYLHEQDIIHGNLRMETIFVSGNGSALLGDFGVVSVERASGVKITDLDHGSARWNAPELIDSDIKGNKVPPTRKSDIWSFGCVCYKVFTGRLPFEAYEEDFDVVWALVVNRENPGRSTKSDTELDNWVWTMLNKCWDRKPISRPKCDNIGFSFFPPDCHRDKVLNHGGNTESKRAKEQDSPVDYIHVWSIICRAFNSAGNVVRSPVKSAMNFRPDVDECYNRVSGISDSGWGEFVAGLIGDGDAENLADCLDFMVHDKKTYREPALLRLLILAEKAQVFPTSHKLQGLKIAFGDNNPHMDRGDYLGHKLRVRPVQDFNHTNDQRAWLKAEMKKLLTWAHLSHPNILPFYGLYSHSGVDSGTFLVFPWITDGNLRDYLQRSPDASRLHLVSDILAGLQHLHGLGIVHNNLTTTNVLVSDAGHALLGMGTGRTTYRWMAPELLQTDEQAVGTRESDIWSFGCLCYEVFTRQVPFYQYKQESKVLSVLTATEEIPLGPDLGDGVDEIDDEIWKIMKACWNRDPSARPQCEALRSEYPTLKDDRAGSQPSVAAFWDAIRMSQKMDFQAKFQRILPILRKRFEDQMPKTRSGPVGSGTSALPDSRASECRRLFFGIKGHKTRESLITGLQYEDVEVMADFLEDMLHDAGWAADKEFILSFLVDLTSKAIIIPWYHKLHTIEITEEIPFTGTAYFDIYRAQFQGKRLGVKLFRSFQEDSAQVMRGAIVELTTQVHLSHHNILPLYGAFNTGDRIGLVFPWMERGSLRALIEDSQDTSDRTHLISDILDGLQYLHGRNVAHGDIRAENILVSDGGRALIAGFSVSHVVNTGRLTSGIDPSSGAVRWAAPELVGASEGMWPTLESDIWSFGCVCGEVLTGQIPFNNYRQDHTVISAILKGQMPWRQEDTKAQQYNIPKPMQDMMKACWDYNPAARPRSSEIRSKYIESIALGSTDSEAREPKIGLDPQVVKEIGAPGGENPGSVNYERVLEILHEASGTLE